MAKDDFDFDDLKLDDDINFDEFDSFNEDYMYDSVDSDKSGNRTAISRTVRKGFNAGLSEIRDRTLKDHATGIVSSAISDDSKRAYRDMTGKFSEAKEEIIKSLEPTTRSVRRLVELADKNVAEEGLVRDLVNKVKGWVGEDSKSTVEPIVDEIAKFQEEMNNNFASIESGISAAQTQLSEAKNNANISTLLTQSNLMTKTHLELAKSYYKQDLIIGMRQLVTQERLLTETRDIKGTFLKQLEAIIKNTSLPDAIKMQNKEILKSMAKAKISDKVVSQAFKVINPLEAIKKNAVERITEYTSHANDISEMLADAVDTTLSTTEGMDKSDLLGSIIADKLMGMVYKGASKIIPKSIRKDVNYNLMAMANDPSSWFKSKMTNDPKDAISKLKNKAFGVLSDLTKTENALNKEDIGTYALEDPAIFDGRTHNSINYVIPRLLSKIHNELTAIRSGRKEVYSDDELRYDSNTGSLVSTGKLRKIIKKEEKEYTIDVAKRNIKTLVDVIKRVSKHIAFKGKDKIMNNTEKAIMHWLAINGKISINDLNSREFLEYFPTDMQMTASEFFDIFVEESKRLEPGEISSLMSAFSYASNALVTSPALDLKYATGDAKDLYIKTTNRLTQDEFSGKTKARRGFVRDYYKSKSGARRYKLDERLDKDPSSDLEIMDGDWVRAKEKLFQYGLDIKTGNFGYRNDWSSDINTDNIKQTKDGTLVFTSKEGIEFIIKTKHDTDYDVDPLNPDHQEYIQWLNSPEHINAKHNLSKEEYEKFMRRKKVEYGIIKPLNKGLGSIKTTIEDAVDRYKKKGSDAFLKAFGLAKEHKTYGRYVKGAEEKYADLKNKYENNEYVNKAKAKYKKAKENINLAKDKVDKDFETFLRANAGDMDAKQEFENLKDEYKEHILKEYEKHKKEFKETSIYKEANELKDIGTTIVKNKKKKLKTKIDKKKEELTKELEEKKTEIEKEISKRYKEYRKDFEKEIKTKLDEVKSNIDKEGTIENKIYSKAKDNGIPLSKEELKKKKEDFINFGSSKYSAFKTKLKTMATEEPTEQGNIAQEIIKKHNSQQRLNIKDLNISKKKKRVKNKKVKDRLKQYKKDFKEAVKSEFNIDFDTLPKDQQKAFVNEVKQHIADNPNDELSARLNSIHNEENIDVILTYMAEPEVINDLENTKSGEEILNNIENEMDAVDSTSSASYTKQESSVENSSFAYKLGRGFNRLFGIGAKGVKGVNDIGKKTRPMEREALKKTGKGIWNFIKSPGSFRAGFMGKETDKMKAAREVNEAGIAGENPEEDKAPNLSKTEYAKMSAIMNSLTNNPVLRYGDPGYILGYLAKQGIKGAIKAPIKFWNSEFAKKMRKHDRKLFVGGLKLAGKTLLGIPKGMWDFGKGLFGAGLKTLKDKADINNPNNPNAETVPPNATNANAPKPKKSRIYRLKSGYAAIKSKFAKLYAGYKIIRELSGGVDAQILQYESSMPKPETREEASLQAMDVKLMSIDAHGIVNSRAQVEAVNEFKEAILKRFKKDDEDKITENANRKKLSRLAKKKKAREDAKKARDEAKEKHRNAVKEYNERRKNRKGSWRNAKDGKSFSGSKPVTTNAVKSGSLLTRLLPTLLTAGTALLGGLKSILWAPFEWLGGKLLGAFAELGGALAAGWAGLKSKLGFGSKDTANVKDPKNAKGANKTNVDNKSKASKNKTKQTKKRTKGNLPKTNKPVSTGTTAQKKEIAKKIPGILEKCKARAIKKLGPKAGGKLVATISAKIAARAVPFAGWALLLWDAGWVLGYMVIGYSLLSAVSKQILGFDLFNDDEIPVDEDGNPIKPDEDLAKDKTTVQSKDYKDMAIGTPKSENANKEPEGSMYDNEHVVLKNRRYVNDKASKLNPSEFKEHLDQYKEELKDTRYINVSRDYERPEHSIIYSTILNRYGHHSLIEDTDRRLPLMAIKTAAGEELARRIRVAYGDGFMPLNGHEYVSYNQLRDEMLRYYTPLTVDSMVEAEAARRTSTRKPKLTKEPEQMTDTEYREYLHIFKGYPKNYIDKVLSKNTSMVSKTKGVSELNKEAELIKEDPVVIDKDGNPLKYQHIPDAKFYNELSNKDTKDGYEVGSLDQQDKYYNKVVEDAAKRGSDNALKSSLDGKPGMGTGINKKDMIASEQGPTLGLELGELEFNRENLPVSIDDISDENIEYISFLGDTYKENNKKNFLSKLHPVFRKQLLGLAKDYYMLTGHKLEITSAFRSAKTQQALINRLGLYNRETNPKGAGSVGGSKHMYGLAVDINTNNPGFKQAKSYGLFDKWGIYQSLPSEKWHYSPVWQNNLVNNQNGGKSRLVDTLNSDFWRSYVKPDGSNVTDVVTKLTMGSSFKEIASDNIDTVVANNDALAGMSTGEPTPNKLSDATRFADSRTVSNIDNGTIVSDPIKANANVVIAKAEAPKPTQPTAEKIEDPNAEVVATQKDTNSILAELVSINKETVKELRSIKDNTYVKDTSMEDSRIQNQRKVEKPSEYKTAEYIPDVRGTFMNDNRRHESRLDLRRSV